MAQDPYQELGVSRTASDDEVRKAFRKLAKQLHPDKNPGDKAAEDRFKRVSGAFDIVGDPDKRKKFDRGEIDADGREGASGFPRAAAARPFSGGGNPFGGRASTRTARRASRASISTIFWARCSAPGAARAAAGPGGGRGFASKGSDVRARLEIDLEDSISGALRRITFGDGKNA